MLIHVLLAIEPSADRRRLRRLLPQRDVRLALVHDTAAVQERLVGGDFDLLIVSRRMLPDAPAGWIRSIRGLPERPEIVVLTERETPEQRAAFIAAGCLALLNHHVDDDTLEGALGTLVRRLRGDAIYRLRAERPEEQYSLADFVSDSPAMQLFLELARKVVASDISVLILGETGVGKERLARAIHAEGPRSAGPFMAINCAALPESLLESELFGHEEGAFTGATRARKGYFELAHDGTLFFDEIGEMPIHLQVKLLRALDERRIYRVGAEKPIAVDVRVMAATNKDLELEVQEKRFRPDLFYRFAVVTLTIPPLRDRKEDIPPLVESYIEHLRAQTRKPITSVNGEAMSVMTRYDWPGNVRELVNAMERAFLIASGEEIRVEDLPFRIVRVAGSVRPTMEKPSTKEDQLLSRPLSEARQEVMTLFESRYLTELLARTKGRIRDAAAHAGINERSLYDLLKRHGLRKEDYKRKRSARRASARLSGPQA